MHLFLRCALLALGLTAGCNVPGSSSKDTKDSKDSKAADTKAAKDTSAPSKASNELTETTDSPDGLMSMRHPSGFEIKTSSSPEGSSLVFHSQPPRHGSATLVSKPHVTLDLNGFVKQFHEPKPSESNEQRKPGTCAGKPGMIITSTWIVRNLPFVRWRCYVVSGGRAAIATYEVIQEHAAEHEPVLRAIVDSAAWKK